MRVSEEENAATVSEVTVVVDHHMLMIYGGEGVELSDGMEGATNELVTSDQHAGFSDGVAVFDIPIQYYPDAPVRVELRASEPEGDHGDWDYVVEAGVKVSTGALSLVGGGTEAVSVPVPDGDYRTRVSGRGYVAARAGKGELVFRVQLWPGDLSGVQVIKQWYAWDD